MKKLIGFFLGLLLFFGCAGGQIKVDNPENKFRDGDWLWVVSQDFKKVDVIETADLMTYKFLSDDGRTLFFSLNKRFKKQLEESGYNQKMGAGLLLGAFTGIMVIPGLERIAQ